MNNRYFGCRTCETYIDAGYRWCYCILEEPGIVERGKRVFVDQILATKENWDPGEEARAQWLRDLLPKINEFLQIHRDHELVFGQAEEVALDEDDFCLVWLYADLEDESRNQIFLSTRYMVDVLNFRQWEQAEDYVSQIPDGYKPLWIDYPEQLAKVQASFEQLLHLESDSASGNEDLVRRGFGAVD